MTRLKLRPNYVLAFAVRGKRKVGRFYSPTKGSYADYHETLGVLVGDLGRDCVVAVEGVEPGSKCYVMDVYELEDLPLYIWNAYRGLLPKAAVEALEKEAKETDGFITANVLHENSLFAVEEVH